MRGFGWVAVVPVKRLPLAKTRLRGALPGVPHERLVVAMALDTVAAVLACARVRRVLVVTDDPLAGPALAELGAERVGHEPAGGPPRHADTRARGCAVCVASGGWPWCR